MGTSVGSSYNHVILQFWKGPFEGLELHGGAVKLLSLTKIVVYGKTLS
jgi:hypothetical protein